MESLNLEKSLAVLFIDSFQNCFGFEIIFMYCLYHLLFWITSACIWMLLLLFAYACPVVGIEIIGSRSCA